jgi:hypothetical protein
LCTLTKKRAFVCIEQESGLLMAIHPAESNDLQGHLQQLGFICLIGL